MTHATIDPAISDNLDPTPLFKTYWVKFLLTFSPDFPVSS
jgi:hypothetical protein